MVDTIMAFFFFSVLVLVGLVPAIFFLDRLFKLNLEKGPMGDPRAKDVFWAPRTFADTAQPATGKPKRSVKNAATWLYNTPDWAEDDLSVLRVLYFYRIFSYFALFSISMGVLFLIVF